MAKTRPTLSGIFKLKGKRDSQILLTGMSYNSTESVSPGQAAGFSKSPKQIGNYKPKMFSIADTVEDSTSAANRFNYSGQRTEPEPAVPSTSGLSPANYTPRYVSLKESVKNKNSNTSENKTSVKKGHNVKSSKNFIMMGDKDTPVVLETGDSSLDGNELPDELPGEDPYSVQTVTNGLEQTLSFTEEEDKHAPVSPDMDTEHPVSHGSDGADRNGVSGVESSQPDVPYIPPPDYDEVSMTLDMADEDPNQPDTPTSYRTIYRTYQGDDFSQYIEEADSVYKTPSDRIQRRSKSSSPRKRHVAKPKSGEKSGHSREKSFTDTLSKAIFGSPAKSNGADTAKRHNIHEFSYGHSKLANDSYSHSRHTVANGKSLTRETNHRRHTGTREGGYEQFLKARHSKGGSVESTSDSGNETADDLDRNESYAHKDFTNTSYSTPNKYVKRNGIWEKLTLRFRRRSRGEIGTVN